MNTLDALEALRAMTLLGDLASGKITRAVIEELGFRDAGRWEKLTATYFGPTRRRKLQAAAREAAASLSLDAVVVIEKHLRHVSPDAEWELRVELCGLRGTVDEIDREAAARVRAHLRPGNNRGLRAVQGGKNSDALGMRTLTARLPERDMARMLSYLDATAATLRAKNPSLSLKKARADALVTHVTGGIPGNVPPPPVPMVVIPKPKYAELLRQDGDETVFGLTDGTTITGRELVAEGMAEEGYFGLFCPTEGGMNLYREQRFASPKQRALLAAETLLCPTPGCTTPADQCQVHHIVPWAQGGETNMPNMTIACRVHNARNDDNPHAPPRNGRLERRPGGVVHIPPDGRPPRSNRHPVRRLSAMGILADA